MTQILGQARKEQQFEPIMQGSLPAAKPLLPRAAGGKLGNPASAQLAGTVQTRAVQGVAQGIPWAGPDVLTLLLVPCSKRPPAMPALQPASHPRSKHAQCET